MEYMSRSFVRRQSLSRLLTDAGSLGKAYLAVGKLSARLTRSWIQANRCFSSSSMLTAPTITGDQNSKDDRLLVVGSGVAGSAVALIAAEIYKVPVLQLFAGQVPTDCNSYWAQGGIIYRNYQAESGDSAELLAADIHRAGANLCDEDAVSKVCAEGPARIRQLLLDSSGSFCQVPFDRNDKTGELLLCLEASHSAARILFNADHTGKTITQHLAEACARHPLIEQRPFTLVTDLVVVDHENEGVPSSTIEASSLSLNGSAPMCIGVQTLHRGTGEQQIELSSRGVVLASGGLAGIYQHSTNPAGFNALGSSVALAIRAGAKVQDLEYVQFHPTALYLPNEARFLLTEALRGEGAILRDSTGRAFARDYHVDGELAPRDVVARAVYTESQKHERKDHGTSPTSADHQVYLDITHRNPEWLRNRFPSIHAHLEERGLDLAQDLLPITPAAHYTCGGVSTDLYGRTSLQGLYAAGEAARTGLHGGNRLASTSLLEGLVFGASVADFIGNSEQGRNLHDMIEDRLRRQAAGSKGTRQSSSERALSALEPWHIEIAAHHALLLLQRLRQVMWDRVGVVRSPKGLQLAEEELTALREEAEHWYTTCPTLETAAVRDASYAGLAVCRAALANPISAGAHCLIPDNEMNTDKATPDKLQGEADNEDDETAAARALC